ncbi:MAG: hypothetical protein U1G07_20870 [Verrucomicrobiota bacterium]
MNELFSPEAQRNPYPLYEQLRRSAPVQPSGNLWLLLDYASVKRAPGNR